MLRSPGDPRATPAPVACRKHSSQYSAVTGSSGYWLAASPAVVIWGDILVRGYVTVGRTGAPTPHTSEGTSVTVAHARVTSDIVTQLASRLVAAFFTLLPHCRARNGTLSRELGLGAAGRGVEGSQKHRRSMPPHPLSGKQ